METTERKITRRSRGFTLIEMLVVIVIMVILMGVVFRLTRGAMNKSDAAKEEALVTKVRTLIEEFHAEYGIYPPVPVYETQAPACGRADCEKANKGKCPARFQQPINFRGACPDGTKKPSELKAYPKLYSNAKINDKECYFIFGLFSFFVDRSKYGQLAFDVNGDDGEPEVGRQWGAQNDSVGGIGSKITISQKDKAFAHRVWPIVNEVCSQEGHTFDAPTLWLEYDLGNNGYCKGFTTHVRGCWANEFAYDGYDEGLVYISKPPYTTYLLFSKGPDGKFDHVHPGDRDAMYEENGKPVYPNKDNIYGNLGDK